ncbi:MAG TPA: class I SAM-dependent methyltransferase [Terriglobales bacterium]
MAAQEKPGAPPNPVAIFNAARAYQDSFVVKAGVDLDVFTAVAKGSHTAAEIARATNASERGIRILSDALTVLGFLDKTGDRYSLTPDSATFLDSRSPAYLGGAFKFLLHASHVENMAHFAESVRRGGSSNTDHHLDPDDDIWVDFARGMAPMMVPAAQAMAASLKGVFDGKAAPKILDIAAGHGVFGVTVAQQIPGAHIYAVDWAKVLQVAKENAKACGVSDRHHLIPGSAFDVDYGTGYDVVLLTNFLHHFDAATNVELLKKIARAMKPASHLVILEFVPNADRVSPPVPAMFSVNMLAGTPHGDAFTFAEIEKMCTDAGFAGVRAVPLEPLPQTMLLARTL